MNRKDEGPLDCPTCWGWRANFTAEAMKTRHRMRKTLLAGMHIFDHTENTGKDATEREGLVIPVSDRSNSGDQSPSAR